jgi:hypothetical protein
VSAEACSFSEVFSNECGNDTTALLAAARWTPFMGVMAAWHVSVRIVGSAGERVVGGMLNLDKNTRAITDTLSGRNRVPDFWRSGANTIIEVNNISYVSYSEQIRDFAAWAVSHRGRSFELWVRENATLSIPLQNAINSGLITLRTFTWP